MEAVQKKHKRRYRLNWKKLVSSIATLISVLFLAWMLISWLDVNLHNGLDRYGNPQGGTQWKQNAFVVMIDLMNDQD